MKSLCIFLLLCYAFAEARSSTYEVRIDRNTLMLKTLLFGTKTQVFSDFANFSPAQCEGVLGDVENKNDDIDTTEIQDENEQTINAIYLKLVRKGIDSLNEDDKDIISSLSAQCPYIGGNAVYKARSLNYNLQPGAIYDDMKTCNTVGVYKQGNVINSNANNTSLISLENEALSHIKANFETAKLRKMDILIYPNPTDGIINIHYNSPNEYEVSIKDLTGRKVMQILLPSGINKTQIDLRNLTNGIYTYEIANNKVIIKTGKINKQ